MFRTEDLVKEMDGLYTFARRLTDNRYEAEDLLQATLLRALEKRALFERGSSLFKWTSKIMFNIFASHYRHKQKFESQVDPQPIMDRQACPASQYDCIQCLEVGEAMREMSEEHRHVLLSICFRGLQYKTVAKRLNVPVGTVRSRLSRAREQLQRNLSKRRTSPSRFIADTRRPQS